MSRLCHSLKLRHAGDVTIATFPSTVSLNQITSLPEPSSQQPSAEPSFEQALNGLESIVHELEEGQLGLAEALARYEEGVKLLKQCYGLLECAERRIELLTGVDAEGKPITRPFDDSATFDPDEKTAVRSRRRSAPPTRTPAESPPDVAGMDLPGTLF